MTVVPLGTLNFNLCVIVEACAFTTDAESDAALVTECRVSHTYVFEGRSDCHSYLKAQEIRNCRDFESC
jgi:hypothetical protein